MENNIQQWRSVLCQSLIAAGKTDAQAIISEVSALETFVYGAPLKAAEVGIKRVEEIKTSQNEKEVIVDKVTTTKAAIEEQSAQARDELQDAESTAPTPTKAEITTALMAVAKKNRQDLITILTKFGTDKVSGLKAEDYPQVMQLAESVLETANV